jgi:phosphatidylserine decarboxylase
VGRLSDLRLPPPILLRLLKAYVAAFRVDLDDVAQPLESFRTFDEFFTRELRAGTRPIAPGARCLASPVDGKVMNCGVIRDGLLLQVKGVTYAVSDLLDDADAARRFDGGTWLTLYLSPRDYHRVHAPVDGDILGYRYTPGRLYPVNAIGTKWVQGLLRRNERLTTWLRTPLGQMALVMVGATSVGRISVTYADIRTNVPGGTPQALYYARPKPLSKGAELGTFHLGSTVVLLVEPPALELETALVPEQPVRLGQALARR